MALAVAWPGLAFDTVSADHLGVTTWNSRHGLPANHVTALAHARDGYLWVGTRQGLARFDGDRFTPLTPETAPAIPHDSVRALLEDSHGALWIATKRGVVQLREGAIKVFRKADGLASDTAMAFLEGAGGQIWVGGDAGVSRIEEDRLRAFTPLPEPNYSVLSLAREPNRGGILVGTETGVYTLDPGRGQFDLVWRSPAVPDDHDPPMVRHLATDETGRLWAGGNFGLYCLHPDGRAEPWGEDRGVTPGRVEALLREPGRGLWVIAGDRIHLLRSGATSFLALNTDLRVPSPLCLAPGPSGGLWIGTERRGLSRVIAQPVMLHGPREGLLHEQAWSVIPSRRGGLWLATENGLQRFDQGRVRETLPVDPRTGPRNLRNGVELSDGTLVLGSAEQGVFSRLPDSGSWVHLEEWCAGSQPNALYLEDDSTLWIGAKEGLSRIRLRTGSASPLDSHPDPAPVDEVKPPEPAAPLAREILVFRRGWVSVRRGQDAWFRRDGQWYRRQDDTVRPVPRSAVIEALGSSPADEIPEGTLTCESVRVIKRDRQGNLWIGTASGGLLAIRQGRLETVAGPETLGSATVSAIHEESDGSLWLGTGHGLRLLTTDGQVRDLSSTSGLPRDRVSDILADLRGRLWLIGQEGILCLRRADLRRAAEGDPTPVIGTQLGDSEGLAGAEPAEGFHPAGYRAEDGRLWIPTSIGVAAVDPRFFEPPSRPPGVHIEEFAWGGSLGARESAVHDDLPWRSIRRTAWESPGSILRVPSEGGRSVRIRFSVIEFSDPNQTRFRCRLLTRDADWRSIGSRREVFYPDLRPGRYRFEVMAANRWNFWTPEPAALEFVIPTRFHETRLFAGGVLILMATVAGAAVLAYRRHSRAWHALRDARRFACAEEHPRITRDFHGDPGRRRHPGSDSSESGS